MAVPVTVEGVVRVTGKIVKVGPFPVATGLNAIYAATDAFGGKFIIAVPESGLIQGVRFIDGGDMVSTTLTVHLFNDDFTAPADNVVYDVPDDDYLKIEASILIDTFRDQSTCADHAAARIDGGINPCDYAGDRDAWQFIKISLHVMSGLYLADMIGRDGQDYPTCRKIGDREQRIAIRAPP